MLSRLNELDLCVLFFIWIIVYVRLSFSKKKVCTSPTRLGVRAFQSCQGVWGGGLPYRCFSVFKSLNIIHDAYEVWTLCGQTVIVFIVVFFSWSNNFSNWPLLPSFCHKYSFWELRHKLSFWELRHKLSFGELFHKTSFWELCQKLSLWRSSQNNAYPT